MNVEWTNTKGATFRIADTALEYACYGPPPSAAPTLVLLHEGLGCVALWRDFPEQLAKSTGMGVFVYSRAGYGASDTVSLPRPMDYMTREAVENLGPILDAMGIREAVLVGHSDGATIAAIYAGSISDMRIRGLVLIAPHFFAESTGLDAIRDVGVAFASGGLRAKLALYHNDPDVAFKGWHDVWTHPAFEDWNVADCIDHWRIPVLAIQGRDDVYGTLAQIDEISDRIYSPLEISILDSCGHAPHLEQPQKTLGAIGEFTQRLNRLERADVSTA